MNCKTLFLAIALLFAGNFSVNAAGESSETAVDVKSWVKCRKVVNILVSEDLNSGRAPGVVYAEQNEEGGVAVSSSEAETNMHKGEIYAQWVISADKNANSVTFINRETGRTIPGIELYKTSVANVYTTGDAGLFEDRFVELREVENTTQFDGYLNLSNEELNREYTLWLNLGSESQDKEIPLVAKNTEEHSELFLADDKDAGNLFTFKLARTMSDGINSYTVFINMLAYNYYIDGKLVTANDTLKAISYSFVDLKNVTKNTAAGYIDKDNDIVNLVFLLDYSKNPGAKSGKFLFRKSGSKYQIVRAEENVYSSNFVSLGVDNAVAAIGVIQGTEEAQTIPAIFSLKPLAE